jgi:hypothetical protein
MERSPPATFLDKARGVVAVKTGKDPPPRPRPFPRRRSSSRGTAYSEEGGEASQMSDSTEARLAKIRFPSREMPRD